MNESWIIKESTDLTNILWLIASVFTCSCLGIDVVPEADVHSMALSEIKANL